MGSFVTAFGSECQCIIPLLYDAEYANGLASWNALDKEGWSDDGVLGFRDNSSFLGGNMVITWLGWMTHKSEKIRHFKNRGKVHLGDCALPVDGLGTSSSTLYHRHG